MPVEERERIRRNLTVAQWAAVVGGTLGALADLATHEPEKAFVLLVGIGVTAISIWLRRRGRLQLSALVLLICLVTVIHGLCAVGEGIQDIATMLYPVAILVAALMLDRGLLVAVTAACVVSVVVLILPHPPRPPDWGFAFDASIILVVTAVAVYRLLVDVVRGAVDARSKERRLAEAYRDLETRNAELERFTHVVSHDLKSPLVTIRGFLDYVEKDARAGDLERMAADAERIRGATERMERLLDDLLELSRTGRIAREPEDVAFEDVVRAARDAVDGHLVPRGVRVEVDPAAAGRVVRGDPARLVELMQNLLANAARFMGDQKEPRIAIGVREAPSTEPVFTVSDNGAGIDPTHHERVFDLFHKLDPNGEGNGLGLALVRRIVESHRGRVWVESEGCGRGSTFCFTLPRGTGPA
jgi:signal transduction histidine kinase